MVTLKDIAKRAGVSTYTVSCALRQQAQVAEATRARIQALAEEMGYRPEASAVVLAGHRRGGRSRNRKMSLAYFIQTGTNPEWPSHFEEAGRGLGFEVLGIEVSGREESRTLAKVVWNRGVQGLLFAPGNLRDPAAWRDFDWSRFAVVKLSRAAPDFRFHLIRHDAFDYAFFTLRKVFAHGYQRVAFLQAPSISAEDDSARLGAALAYRQVHLTRGQRLEVYFDPRGGGLDVQSLRLAPALAAKLRAYRPDAAVCFPWIWYYGLRNEGYALPGDLALASLIVPNPAPGIPDLAGCLRQFPQMMRRAAASLEQSLILGERGMVENPREDVIEPIWREGATLPAR